MKVIIRFGALVGLISTLFCSQTSKGAVAFTLTPNTISNTYAGIITLHVTGLNNGENVVVQKFLDVNNNGVVDAGDYLFQQFNLTDGQPGMVIGGVTNINVPGDTDSTAGQITASLNFQNGDFAQGIIGKYLYKLSSPTGAATNSLTVTNFPFAQKITGTVTNNGVGVPNAAVILFPAPRGGDHGPGSPVAGALANGSGVYSISVPAGTYMPLAFKSNYVANFGMSPLINLGNGRTVNTNLSLATATRSISGRLVNMDTGAGIPGIFIGNSSDTGYIGTTFTDTNGYFTERVSPANWKFDGSPAGLIVLGYVGYDGGTNMDATSGNVSGLVFGFKKASALFYGTVKDNLGNPLAGIDINADDGSMFASDGYSDANGNYASAAVNEGMSWNIGVSSGNAPTNYIFTSGSYLPPTARVDFTGILATNHITGNVQFNGSPVSGVQVYAYANIGGSNYQAQMDTDGNGDYSLNVANGSWTVNVYDCGCSDNDSLNNVLSGQGYQEPSSRNVNINNGDGTANFTIQPCNGVQILTSSPLPDAQQGQSYYEQLQASDCNNQFNWSVNDPADFPYGLNLSLDSAGEIFGTPTGSGTFHFSVHVDDGNGHSADSNMSLTITPAASPLEVTTTSLPNATNTEFYSQTLQASGGTPPYGWSLASYSALPSNLSLTTNGVLSGTPSTAVNTYYFDVVVTDSVAGSITQTLSLNVVNPPLPPLVITNISLPNGNVGVPYGAQLGATGGQPPYFWSYALGSQNLSAIGLSLSSNGLISGTPATNRVFSFKVQVTDASVSDPPTNKVLSIIVNPDPVLAAPNWLTNRFQMLLIGASNQNYTLLSSTNLGSTNWIPLYVTNNATANSFILSDPNATNIQRFYRVLIGP